MYRDDWIEMCSLLINGEGFWKLNQLRASFLASSIYYCIKVDVNRLFRIQAFCQKGSAVEDSGVSEIIKDDEINVHFLPYSSFPMIYLKKVHHRVSISIDL